MSIMTSFPKITKILPILVGPSILWIRLLDGVWAGFGLVSAGGGGEAACESCYEWRRMEEEDGREKD